MRVEFVKEWMAHRIGAVATLAGGVAEELVRRGICRPAPEAAVRVPYPTPKIAPNPAPKRVRA